MVKKLLNIAYNYLILDTFLRQLYIREMYMRSKITFCQYMFF